MDLVLFTVGLAIIPHGCGRGLVKQRYQFVSPQLHHLLCLLSLMAQSPTKLFGPYSPIRDISSFRPGLWFGQYWS